MIQRPPLAPSLLRMLRTHITSPYVLLWRTIEVAVLIDLAAHHGLDLRTEIDLDAGCGNGVLGSALAQQIALGFDLSCTAVRWAGQHKPAYRTLMAASSTAIPLEDRSRHLVFSNSVIEHIPDDQAALDELARVVAPGGYLLFSTVSTQFPGLILDAGADDVARTALDTSYAHYHYYTPADLRTALHARGLTVLDHKTYINGRQARLMYRLRQWEAAQPRTGLARRLAQIRRIPVAIGLLPMLRPQALADDSGAGLAILARR